jgi:hypothetical protein
MSRNAILAALIVCAILAGCSGQGAVLNQPGLLAVAPSIRKASWMKSQASHQRLIYISNLGDDVVNVYAFDGHEIVGQLKGLKKPHGMCTDSHGNVYVTNTGASNVLEYAHGGTKPIQTFSDPGENPVDCDIVRFGELVAANESTTSGGVGGLSYFEGTRPAQNVSFQRLPTVLSIGYLPAVGFNFLTGLNADGNPQYAKFRFSLDLLSIPFTSAGSVRYAGFGKYMAVGDQSGDVYLVEGKAISSETHLNGLCAAGQFSITRKFIFVPDPCGDKVLIYPFPSGGTAFYQIDGQSEPVGTAISEDGLRGP